MTTGVLTAEEIRAGAETLAGLYPDTPSLLAWRAWELAAYRRYSLTEPVLDVGCGDGRFLRAVWPDLREVVGVDSDPRVAAAARASGVYRQVLDIAAQELPFGPGTFASAFANCSLEHMDDVDAVLTGIAGSLRPGASFLLSVVTDRFVEWDTLPALVAAAAGAHAATDLRRRYVDYHHLVNPLPPAAWMDRLAKAGFEVVEHVPIVPEFAGRLFLMIDHLWHLPAAMGELGTILAERVRSIPRFPHAFGKVLAAVAEMERDTLTGCGAVFHARRRDL